MPNKEIDRIISQLQRVEQLANTNITAMDRLASSMQKDYKGVNDQIQSMIRSLEYFNRLAFRTGQLRSPVTGQGMSSTIQAAYLSQQRAVAQNIQNAALGIGRGAGGQWTSPQPWSFSNRDMGSWLARNQLQTAAAIKAQMFGRDTSRDDLDEKAAKAKEALTARQVEFNNAFKNSPRAIADAERQLARYGLTTQELARVQIDPISGIREFTFQTDASQGVVKRATLAVDRYGQTLGSTATKFRGFSDMIARNTVKVLEWAVAVGAVYGTLRHLTQAFETLVEFNESMSDIQLSTGEATDAVVTFFDTASQAARDSGTTLEGVLTIYDDALKSVRNLEDAGKRFSVAQDLVSNALMYSRLSGKDTKTAMDDLIGSLRQVATKGMDSATALSQGGDLLDTWVYASYRANISMEDLAETFAVTGAAATAAGVSIDRLAAMASVLSESTSKSASEVGNTIRRLIGQTESDSGVKALSKYSIAIETVTGEAKNWDDVMTDIAVKYRAGVLSDKALRDLAYAIGGGPRGSADFIALIKEWNSVMDKSADISAKKNGAAHAALAIKAKTLKSAINELSVAFETLTIRLGTEGGLIPVFTKIVELLTRVVDGMTSLTTALGPATTKIAAMVLAFSLLSRYGGFLKGKFMEWSPIATGMQAYKLGTAKPWLYGTTAEGQYPYSSYQYQAPTPVSTKLRARFGENKTGLAMAGVLAATEVGTEGGLEKAGATMGGALISTAIGLGPMVGAVIGNAAGNAFAEYAKGTRLLGTPAEDLTDVELQQKYQLARQRVTEPLKTGIFSMFSPPDETIPDQIMKVYEERGAEAAKAFARGLYENTGIENLAIFGSGAEDMVKAVEEMISTREAMGKRGIRTEEEDRLAKLASEARLQRQAGYVRELYTGQVAGALTAGRQASLLAMGKGELPVGEFKERLTGVEAARSQVAPLFDILRTMSSDTLEEVALNFANMGDEFRGELADLTTKAEEAQNTIESTTDKTSVEFLKASVSAKEYKEQILAIYNAAKLAQKEPFQFKGFQDLREFSSVEIKAMALQAKDLQDSYAEMMGIATDEFAAMFETWYFLGKDGWGAQEKLAQEFFDYILQKQEESRKKQSQFNLERNKEITPEMWPELEKRVGWWQQFLGGIPGYNAANPAQEFNMVIGDDPQWRRLVTTQDALRYAIEELTEVEKKQLEGQWNIPEGATVMVPLTSLYYKGKGGAPGTPLGGQYAGGPAAGTTEDAILPAVRSFTEALNEVIRQAVQVAPPETLKRFSQFDMTKHQAPRLETNVLPPESLQRYSKFEMTPAANASSRAGGPLGDYLSRPANQLTSASANLQRAATALENARIYVYNTVNLDGKVIARYVSQQQTRNLQRSIRSYGEASGSVIA